MKKSVERCNKRNSLLATWQRELPPLPQCSYTRAAIYRPGTHKEQRFIRFIRPTPSPLRSPRVQSRIVVAVPARNLIPATFYFRNTCTLFLRRPSVTNFSKWILTGIPSSQFSNFFFLEIIDLASRLSLSFFFFFKFSRQLQLKRDTFDTFFPRKDFRNRKIFEIDFNQDV